MSLLVLVLGLSAVATAVLVWYVGWRRAQRAEEARLWREHREWLEASESEQR